MRAESNLCRELEQELQVRHQAIDAVAMCAQTETKGSGTGFGGVRFWERTHNRPRPMINV